MDKTWDKEGCFAALTFDSIVLCREVVSTLSGRVLWNGRVLSFSSLCHLHFSQSFPSIPRTEEEGGEAVTGAGWLGDAAAGSLSTLRLQR